jgi:hypothetical protein
MCDDWFCMGCRHRPVYMCLHSVAAQAGCLEHPHSACPCFAQCDNLSPINAAQCDNMSSPVNANHSVNVNPGCLGVLPKHGKWAAKGSHKATVLIRGCQLYTLLLHVPNRQCSACLSNRYVRQLQSTSEPSSRHKRGGEGMHVGLGCPVLLSGVVQLFASLSARAGLRNRK